MLSEFAIDERKMVETFVSLGSRIKMDRVLEINSREENNSRPRPDCEAEGLFQVQQRSE